MRQARVVVSAAVDDGHPAVLVQTLEPDHRRMEAEVIVDLEDLARRNSDVRPGAVVRRVAMRHDRVEAVVPARQFEDDEDPFGMPLHARALKGLSRERRRRAVQENRQPGAEADAVEAASQKITT